jgi:hypothetical protein
MPTELRPWFAHEYPDRPLVEGAVLCCCVLCAVSLERAGQEDARRPIVFHTAWGARAWGAQIVALHRGDTHLHDMLSILGPQPGNWVEHVTVGPRRGRGAKGWEPEGDYPRPLESWPVCSHCGPLSDATFATLTELGAPRRRRSARQRAADERSRLVRAALVERVEAINEQRRFTVERDWRAQWRILQPVPDDERGRDDWW